jgi:signal transduction histidine kinase
MFRRSAREMRVLILAPVGRDARLIADTLAALDIETKTSPDAESLISLLAEGAGSAIVAEEALTADRVPAVAAWLASQPPWSDMPFVILTSTGMPTPESKRRARQMETLGNFTLIERPVRPETLQSAARSALRARLRQYEMRSRQEALIRANADLEQFAYSASHDLREPIRSISVFSELLMKHYDRFLDQKGKEYLSFLQSGALRMETLLTDLLSYARASSIPDDSPEPICARGPLDAALENLAGAIRESGACIAVGEMPMVRMRQSHLEQVFQNLVGNAIKYRREGSLDVHVAAHKADNHWLFCVEDNGIGIAAEYRETIFGIFKRLHTNQEYSGTGMGLAICQRIVERCRGRIWVESEPGRGSKFFFTVPA